MKRRSSSSLIRAGVLLLALVGTACTTGRNYLSPIGPVYRGTVDSEPSARLPDSLLVVSFNVEFAMEIDSATLVLTTDPDLRSADIVLLQEMDEPGTRLIAEATGMSFVFYPALYHLKKERDFGNAVLSKWPIVADDKLILPNTAGFSGNQRIATAATLAAGIDTIRVYSAHFGTLIEIDGGARREQMGLVLADAESYARVIIGGDMNSGGVGATAVQAGFEWPTREGPRTTRWGRWDHIFLKGLEASRAGTVREVRGASDHLPVWTVVRLR